MWFYIRIDFLGFAMCFGQYHISCLPLSFGVLRTWSSRNYAVEIIASNVTRDHWYRSYRARDGLPWLQTLLVVESVTTQGISWFLRFYRCITSDTIHLLVCDVPCNIHTLNLLLSSYAPTSAYEDNKRFHVIKWNNNREKKNRNKLEMF